MSASSDTDLAGVSATAPRARRRKEAAKQAQLLDVRSESLTVANHTRIYRRILAFVHKIDTSPRWINIVPGADRDWEGDLVLPELSRSKAPERVLHVYNAAILMDAETKNAEVAVQTLPSLARPTEENEEELVSVELPGLSDIKSPDRWSYRQCFTTADWDIPLETEWTVINEEGGFPEPVTVYFHLRPEPGPPLKRHAPPLLVRKAGPHHLPPSYDNPRHLGLPPPFPADELTAPSPSRRTSRASSHNTPARRSSSSGLHPASISSDQHRGEPSDTREAVFAGERDPDPAPSERRFTDPQFSHKEAVWDPDRPESDVDYMRRAAGHGERPSIVGRLPTYSDVKKEGRAEVNASPEEVKLALALTDGQGLEMLHKRIRLFVEQENNNATFRGEGLSSQHISFSVPHVETLTSHRGDKSVPEPVVHINAYLQGVWRRVRPEKHAYNAVWPAFEHGRRRLGFVLPGEELDPEHATPQYMFVRDLKADDGSRPLKKTPTDYWTFSSRAGFPVRGPRGVLTSLYATLKTTFVLRDSQKGPRVVVTFARHSPYEATVRTREEELKPVAFEFGRRKVRVLKNQPQRRAFD
ncbi:hypothetical protein JCM10213v2_001050 [Rhodosporidiobolus nylandii]